MGGCRHIPNKAQRFCERYGEYVPETNVKIEVGLTDNQSYWLVTCSHCMQLVETCILKNNAVESALQHEKTDHPRDLVTISVIAETDISGGDNANTNEGNW